MSEDLLRGRELADQHHPQGVRRLVGKLLVELRVVLAVVPDQDPAQLRQVADEAAQLPALVCLPGPEPAVGCR